MREKKAKGLCFKCDGRYHAGHQCRYRELQVLVVGEDGVEYDAGEEEEEGEETQAGELMAEVAELSMNSVVGITSPKTIKLKGTVRDLEVIVLIDSGATHNFVSPKIIEKLGLITDGTRGYGVIMGTGLAVKGMGVCRGVELLMQNYLVTLSLLPLKLGNADIILGVEWLETLGEVKSNWKEQVMKFNHNGTTVTLRGDPSLCNSPVSLKALWKALKDDGEGIIVEYGALQATTEKGSTVESIELEGILAEYEGIFSEPQGLPPSRD